ncbi:hypothetical protein BaRGS_00016203 [Batillaria attramentaria]|uniref:Elongator complex protein 1 n=1 Tax=Batillaria attramentaria TaxID=370345 RepID=A0ABD0L0H8_9CAEN
MRNLKLQYTSRVPPSPPLEGSHDICVDPDSGRVILVTSTSALVLDPSSAQVTNSQSLVSDAALPADGTGHVVGVHYLPDQTGVCLATSNGNLALWALDLNELECVGSVESGLTSMAWSPDQELLVLTTGAATVIIMTREFDPVTEMPLHSDEFGEGELMAVGWGKKETQFHGSEGKQAAQRQKESSQPALPWDDRQPRVKWRGDGQFFAVSSINPANGARYIRVWSREGALQSTSEPMNGLEQALFWKPSGSLVASTQRKPNKHDVVFFEKNGLQHGEFTLPFGVKEVKVTELMWNMDSTILAVWCQDLPFESSTEPTSEVQSYVQLWTCSNYHWSLKQSLSFGGRHGNVAAVTWDPEHAGRLHVVTSVGQYLQYTWTWATNHSLGQTSCDPANVFLINGSTVGVTPLRKMVVPPPMSAYQLLLPSPASQVVSPASPADAAGDIAVLTNDNQLLVFSSDVKSPTENKAVKLDAAGGDGFFAQCSTPTLRATYRTPVMVEDSVISLSVNTEIASSVAVQLITGTVLRFSLEDESLLPWETVDGRELHFPFACSQMEVTSFCGEEAVLGLTDRFRFYVNGTEVASNCTSFAVHGEFLLLTTLSHTVRCINRHTPVKDLPSLSDGKAHPFDESIRRVERGSRIVAVVAEDTKLVLQMPRGNLETIHPRALVLAAVRRLLDKCDFGSAFTIMKKHRINLNLLYDHNPQVFLQHVADFIHQVSTVTNINLFLTELQEDDVTVTMYTAAYNRASATSAASGNVSTQSKGPSKVDTVCDAIRRTLETEDADRYRLAVLTTYVKKTTPELQKALELVWELRESGETKGGIGAEEALKFLLFLVDVNNLYNAALATYNFDLVLMVAEKSQKDPKEYIPFLNQLRRLEENYCKFTIDKHLKRYTSALKHIAICGADHFNECVDLVQEHKLYTEALKLFPTDSLEFKTLAREYGHYLREKNRHDEAGIAFMRAEYWQLAFDSFVTALSWRQAMCMAAQLNFDPAHMADAARKMAVRLKDSKRCCEAAVLFEHHAKWEEALRLMYTYQRTDIIETHLRDAVSDACRETMATLEAQQAEMEHHVARLAVVRVSLYLSVATASEDHHPDNPNADLFSDTSSATGESIQSSIDSNRSTVFSKMSGRSNRNRRKADHKKWSLKEGSPFEDCALIDAIAKIITSVDGMRDEINALLRVLVQFHQVEPAEQLQAQYEGILSSIQTAIPQVWVQQEAADNTAVLGPGMTTNAIVQAVQRGQMLETSNRNEPVLQVAPVLKKDVRWKLHMLQSAEK